jgi:uncharacterized protein YkwD
MEIPSWRRFLVFACLMVLTPGCTGGGGDAAVPEAPGDEVEAELLTPLQRELLQAHNAVRAGARPTPSPALPPLKWSLRAEETARAWAEECRFDHNTARVRLGENLAASTPGAWTAQEMVENLAAEAQDYDLATGRCTGETCGHYTQLVWRTTTGVGCAMKRCTSNSPFAPDFTTWDLWVCNYTPPGNVEGERPY